MLIVVENLISIVDLILQLRRLYEAYKLLELLPRDSILQILYTKTNAAFEELINLIAELELEKHLQFSGVI